MKRQNLVKIGIIASVIALICMSPTIFAEEDDEIVFPFIFGVSSNPSSFDPLGAYDTTSGNVILNVHEGLYAFDYTNEDGLAIIPQIASDMGNWNDDKDTLTISLRRDVTFWDGTKLTAEDVVWNFNRINKLSEDGLNNHGSLWLDENENTILERITATDTHEVEMVLRDFTVAWENLLPWWGASIIKPFTTGMEETLTLEDMDQVIGCGPFMLDGYTAGETTTLVRYDDYYGGNADIQKIQFQFFADTAALTDAMLAHEIHVVRNILDTVWETANGDPDLKVTLLKGDCVYFYHMGVHTTPWAVRKALQFAFNYSYVPTLSVTLPHHNSPIPDGMLGYNGDLDGLPVYDLDLAREYILNSEDIGIQDMIALHGVNEETTDEKWVAIAQGDNPLYRANFTHYGTAFYTFLANFAQDVGVDLVDHQVGNWSEYLAWVNVPENKASLQFAMGGWCPDYSHPVDMLQPLCHSDGISNWNGLDEKQIDLNIEALESLTGDDLIEMCDTLVTQIIVEQAAAMTTVCSADLIAWNVNEDEGIISGAEGLLNSRGDKYFYPIDFAFSRTPPGGLGIGYWFLFIYAIPLICFIYLIFKSLEPLKINKIKKFYSLRSLILYLFSSKKISGNNDIFIENFNHESKIIKKLKLGLVLRFILILISFTQFLLIFFNNAQLFRYFPGYNYFLYPFGVLVYSILKLSTSKPLKPLYIQSKSSYINYFGFFYISSILITVLELTLGRVLISWRFYAFSPVIDILFEFAAFGMLLIGIQNSSNKNTNEYNIRRRKNMKIIYFCLASFYILLITYLFLQSNEIVRNLLRVCIPLNQFAFVIFEWYLLRELPNINNHYHYHIEK